MAKVVFFGTPEYALPTLRALLACHQVLAVVTQGDLAQLLQGRFGRPGDFLILLSAPNWAVFSALSRRGLQRFPAIQMMFYVMTSGWLLSTIFLMAGPGFGEIALLQGDGWTGILFLGIGLTFLLLFLLPDKTQRQSWAIFPAGFMILFGLLILGQVASTINYIWPATLIILGAWLLLRGFRGQA